MIFVALAIVAVVIECRVLLVTGLTDIGAAVGYAIIVCQGSPRKEPFAVAGTLALLGVPVLVLGVGWVPLRRRLVSVLSASVTNRLPPMPVRP